VTQTRTSGYSVYGVVFGYSAVSAASARLKVHESARRRRESFRLPRKVVVAKICKNPDSVKQIARRILQITCPYTARAGGAA
jgi:hypothetical protein